MNFDYVCLHFKKIFFKDYSGSLINNLVLGKYCVILQGGDLKKKIKCLRILK